MDSSHTTDHGLPIFAELSIIFRIRIVMWNQSIYQLLFTFKLVSPVWPTDSVQWLGYSGHSWVTWVTGGMPTYQSPSSINERWARGRFAQSAWLRPLCSCQSPRARSHGSCGDNDTRRPDGVTSEGARRESDSWAERWGPDRSPRHANRGMEGGKGRCRGGQEEGSMMDGVRTALSKEQQGGNGKWGMREWEELWRMQSLHSNLVSMCYFLHMSALYGSLSFK